MKILVLGAGQVGQQICRFLAREENIGLTVLDNNSLFVSSTVEQLGINGVVGEATNPEDLINAGIKEIDLVVAATASDETNVIACYLASKLNSRSRMIARLRNTNYHELMLRKEGGFIDIVINPEAEVARTILQLLQSREIFYRRGLLDEKACLIGIRLSASSNILNTQLRQLTDTFEGLKTVVVAYLRQGQLHAAKSDDEMHDGDKVFAVVATDHLRRTLDIFGIKQSPHEHLVIIGAGNVGIGIARGFEREQGRHSANLIELNKEHAEEAAAILDRTTIFHGDGMNADILQEMNIKTAHAVVAVTQDDKTNLLALAQAKKLNPNLMTIGIVNDPSLTSLDSQLGIDVVINPQAVTVSSILPHTKAGSVRQVQIIGEGEAEVIEVSVHENSPLKGKTIRNANLPKGILIGAMQKGTDIVEVGPDVRVDVGDRFVLFVLEHNIKESTKFLNSYALLG